MQSPVTGSIRRQPSARPSALPDRPLQRSKSSIEIQKFAEDEEDEDFSDIFGLGDNLAEKEESDRGSEDGNLMVLSRLSNNSWLGDDEDEDDPFASMDPDWDEMDLEANIARDRHARLAEKIEELVRSLKWTEGDDKLLELSEDLVSCHYFTPHCPILLTTECSLACSGRILKSRILSSALMDYFPSSNYWSLVRSKADTK